MRAQAVAMNRVQFQPGLTLVDFVARYGTEAKSHWALYKARCPHGFRCPGCGRRARCRFRRGQQIYYQCRVCRHQTTLLSGPLLESTKSPLRTRLLAMYLLTSTKTNMSALELSRGLGVAYSAAWRIKQKIMQAMTEREAPRRLDGIVQIDEAYLGGERNGGKAGRDAPCKRPFVAAVETDATLEHSRFAVLEPVRGFDNASLTDWCTRRLARGAEVYSDGLACFARAVGTGHAHSVLVTAGGRAACEVRSARWVNVVLANVKRPISGRYHACANAKYARRYPGEAQYRLYRRFRLTATLPRLARSVMLCKPCAEPKLRLACNFQSWSSAPIRLKFRWFKTRRRYS